MSMEYVSTSARFRFFNGSKVYTVEYCFGLSKWFIFHDDRVSGAIHEREDKKIRISAINSFSAENILYDYLSR